jgi:transcriptional regulator CtsR
MERKAITKRNLYNLLAELEKSPGEYITIYVKPSSLPCYINELSLPSRYSVCIAEIKQLANIKTVIQGTEKYNTGAAIFWQESGNKHIVLPPFPISDNRAYFGELDNSILRGTLERKYTIGVVLVTWGSYAVGIFHGDNLIESKVGAGYIHKEHKKGGSSQKRFARRTEEQKKAFLRKVSNRIEERLRNQTVDYIFLGGNRLISKPLLTECKYLELQAHKISGRVLNIRYANKHTLDGSLQEITKSLIFTY